MLAKFTTMHEVTKIHTTRSPGQWNAAKIHVVLGSLSLLRRQKNLWST